MKIKQLLVILLIFLSLTPLYAQKKPFTGKITYKITFESEDLPAAIRSMLPTSMAMYIGHSKVKTEIITSMGKQVSITDLRDQSQITLVEVMGQKYALVDKGNATGQENKPRTEVNLTGETRLIAGYPSKKAVVKKLIDGADPQTIGEVWFTDALQFPENLNRNNPVYYDIKGLLTEYTLDAGSGLRMNFSAIEILPMKIKLSAFDVPEGYQLITQEELMNRFGNWQ